MDRFPSSSSRRPVPRYQESKYLSSLDEAYFEDSDADLLADLDLHPRRRHDREYAQDTELRLDDHGSRDYELARERSFRDSKPFVSLEHDPDAYATEQRSLYPPDGYSSIHKRINLDGKRRRRTEDNREHPEKYTAAYNNYSSLKSRYEDADARYRREKCSIQDTESKPLPYFGGVDVHVESFYNDEHSKHLPHDRKGIYSPRHHFSLRESAELREDQAYEYATARMETFDAWPRINRTARSDQNHHGAVEYAWNQHSDALDDRNSHYYYSQDHYFNSQSYPPRR